jgi:hypothetical protein
MLSEADLPPDAARAREAIGRYRVERVTTAASEAFAEAYRLLHVEFGDKGELEREDVVRGWVGGSASEPPTGALERDYHLLIARDPTGRIAAVRDCHVSLDATARICVVYLAHVLVLPEHRRTGLAHLLREAPRVLGRRACSTLEDSELLLAAEMEPVPSNGTEEIVRLVAYGRAGFRVVDPARLPYAQPDFRPHAEIDADRPRPIPMLAVVARDGHPDDDALPRALAAAYVEHLYGVFATHCRAADLVAPRAHALSALGDAPSVPLLPLPRDTSNIDRLRPFARDAVLAHHR